MEHGRILGIAYNVIPVSNLERSAEWFVRHFGFNIRNRREGYLSLFRDNRPILDLIQSDNETRAVFEINNKKRWVITFFTNDIVSLHRYLISEDVNVGSISDEGQYGKFFVLEDLDGNVFDVWEHNDCELIY
ncbi:catechol 2,3-dioxygenase-like lactoylglutathione lyase family enzyme [Paenibacillus amylolyticus]|uniref:Catechol 2,3-dioxygenase-like lactoylglutathione lyase family enzyme n=1 Tax=Paenibacillus amylolyticus TaxID=1451 RepID=A0AAP5LRB2_PAEAM|nr:VOC family protein [Paenibacillus amylolyticus]MDR6724249.1 catechol 2,3-dioxygenase-like lactoylglutathione lyase family enzyme [Paenibacillus amylolyticus]